VPPFSLKPKSQQISPVWSDPERELAFKEWLLPLCRNFELDPDSLSCASADASFRRYFRINSSCGNSSFIIMDAPPDKEDCSAFVRIAELMSSAGLLVPKVFNWRPSLGFMLITDLGSETLLEHLSHSIDLSQSLYTPITPPLKPFVQATDALISWQTASQVGLLANYDEPMLLRELNLFYDWYLCKHLRLRLSTEQHNILQTSFQAIVNNNLSAPQVFVHRDFMTRNLMIPKDSNDPRLGVLDFQDAVFGPVTYDIASLMRDAFCSWSEDFVLDVTVRYWERIKKTGLIDANGWSSDFGEFWRAVEWMGLQRHLKVAGIFARLTLRDNKTKYLLDTPRFFNYIRATSMRYKELLPLLRLLDNLLGNTPEEVAFFGRI
jgi:N-acetylmuramate 1-kinase